MHDCNRTLSSYIAQQKIVIESTNNCNTLPSKLLKMNIVLHTKSSSTTVWQIIFQSKLPCFSPSQPFITQLLLTRPNFGSYTVGASPYQCGQLAFMLPLCCFKWFQSHSTRCLNLELWYGHKTGETNLAVLGISIHSLIQVRCFMSLLPWESLFPVWRSCTLMDMFENECSNMQWINVVGSWYAWLN